MSELVIENLGALILAVGALGTASFGIVEGLKWTRMGTAGFNQLWKILDGPIMEALADDEEYLNVSNGVERVAVLRSRRDRVLKYAYPLGDLVQAFVFFEKWNSALGFSGPKSHKRNSIPKQVFDHRIPNARHARHGDYLPSAPMNGEKESAAGFADDVLSGKSKPIYP